ncbi:helix-turn-helix domain-containing protein [Actinophytocola sp.]|uniref:PucR family transcriptional regulator n=1 Tax=Actinophytocola sp. TaxID=1872138 RepID=UPI002D8105E5|nr:helix-turn-helix domain-containing protein [Actinophytocola sp.]HET9140002.1 helix-turn-helix domain-containing protein [Actinophytocola sp.]
MADRIAFDSLLSRDSTGLWSELPPELGALLRPGAVRLADEIMRELPHCVPALDHRASATRIVAAIQRAVLRFIDRLEDPTAAVEDQADLLGSLGLPEPPDDAVLETLRLAYRTGARVAWRHMARIGEDAGVPTPTLCLLAEAIFAYIDELAARSIEGLAAAQVRAAGARERRRRALLETILSGVAERPDPLAEAAGWPLPERVVAVAVRVSDYPLEARVPDQRILADLDRDPPCLLLDPSEAHLLDELALRLPVARAAAGPAVPLRHARDSLRWAAEMLRLVEAGVLPDAPLTRFDEHLSALWLLHDPFLVGELSDRALAPLAGLTGRARRKLSETLLIWLQSRRGVPEIAEVLGVHPQTVRYRLRRLEQLFGERLGDPQARFDIEVALRARGLNGYSGPPC